MLSAGDTSGTLRIGTDNYSTVLQQRLYGDFIIAHGTGQVTLANNANSWTSASDKRLKKEITPIEDALNKLNQINGYTYHYKNDPDDQPLRVGVIAQEVQKVLPEAVVPIMDGEYLGVQYTDIIPLIINAIKELYKLWSTDHNALEELRQEQEKLKLENYELKLRIEQIEQSLRANPN